MPQPQKLSQQETARLELEGKNILAWLVTGATVWAKADGFTEQKPIKETNNAPA